VSEILNSKVLVLNRSYLPVHVTSLRRAVRLLYCEIALAVDGQYRTFDFTAWLGLEPDGEALGLVGRMMRPPRVILLRGFDRVPRREVRFSRFNVYARDRGQCQYCGRRYPRGELNLDHVMPRSRGGASAWENVVCSCVACNRRKSNRTPGEAGMRLVRAPYRPQWTPFVAETYRQRRHADWLPFLAEAETGEAMAVGANGG
jgi:5-methylcytosine-specific restriction endonuclease McrA